MANRDQTRSSIKTRSAYAFINQPSIPAQEAFSHYFLAKAGNHFILQLAFSSPVAECALGEFDMAALEEGYLADFDTLLNQFKKQGYLANHKTVMNVNQQIVDHSYEGEVTAKTVTTNTLVADEVNVFPTHVEITLNEHSSTNQLHALLGFIEDRLNLKPRSTALPIVQTVKQEQSNGFSPRSAY